ncbi:integrase core domain protein [bacterium BMS3Abin09]|nr:integrase core domain protein [bacterium BMS3Abin09]
MPERDIIKMSIRELKRLKLVQEAIAKQVTQKTAAELMELSERQVRRLVNAVRKDGERGLVHGSRGKPSNNRISKDVRAKAISAYKGSYMGFGPTLASEKLRERERITVSEETMRKWLLEEGLWEKKRRRSPHRRYRERKECFGEMVQMDGSHHDWLEGRGPKLVLMGYIDDATGNVFGKFHDYEGTVPAMDSFRSYTKKYGLPQSVYLDQHSTYKVTRPVKEEEREQMLMSQFERALRELGVKIIHANSPQAKGRVERLFGTLQDRLVKEMRLKGIQTKEEANVFLRRYLPTFNKKFKVPAAKEADLHVTLPKGFDLDDSLCIKTKRVSRNDNTVSLNGKSFQIQEPVDALYVEIQERLKGTLLIKANGKRLKYTEIKSIAKRKKKRTGSKARRTVVPKSNHPWLQGIKSVQLRRAKAN